MGLAQRRFVVPAAVLRRSRAIDQENRGQSIQRPGIEGASRVGEVMEHGGAGMGDDQLAFVG